jgi:hypothetical protein
MKIRDSQIAAVLQDLKYPAAKRQILAEADPYGTNGPIKALLWALPAHQYDSYDDIRAVVATITSPDY